MNISQAKQQGLIVKGKYGNINKTGNFMSDALIFYPDESEFYSCIELGILPLVRTLNNVGLGTFSSCEGHVNTDTGEQTLANVEVYLKPQPKKLIEKSISKTGLNVCLTFGHFRDKPFVGVTTCITFRDSPKNRETLNSSISKLSKQISADFSKIINSK